MVTPTCSCSVSKSSSSAPMMCATGREEGLPTLDWESYMRNIRIMHSTETTNEGTRSKRSLTRSGVSSASGEGQELRLSRGVVFGLWQGVSLWHGLSGTGLGVTCTDQLTANFTQRNHKSASKQMWNEEGESDGKQVCCTDRGCGIVGQQWLHSSIALPWRGLIQISPSILLLSFSWPWR